MGGCCCSSRRPQLHGTPIYYYCPPALEERELLTSNDSAAAGLTTGFLFDLSLDSSVPDTYRPPPAPLPFDVVLVCPRSTNSDSLGDATSDTTFGKINVANFKESSDCKPHADSVLASPKKFEVDILKSNVPMTEEEDVCPTCLEDYDEENPRISTKCNHHFHLSCILEWMERSDTCPICNQDMEFEAL
ncbi:hypothetical protein LguiA_010405 [Lonicera macranthoides]